MNSLSTLSLTAKETIKRNILRGIHQPSEHLAVSKLTKRYEIGASPMREALFLLDKEGYVTMEANRGCYVTPLTFDELEDVKESLLITGNIVIAKAIENADENWQIAQLKFCNQLNQIKNPIGGEGDMIDTLIQFYSSLLTNHKMASMADFLMRLINRFARYVHTFVSYEDAERFLELDKMRNISNLSLTGDKKAAIAYFEAHLETLVEHVRFGMLKRIGEEGLTV
ncbi:GntR family transcriptional regulator [Vibrio maerlii]|uniref:GntR family transcriptional regulator n=1 Tax=Vibrio maerlii TaxID=2231648 RepID=UPI000E3CB73B|nr:GntR family transcriptional regulator [Vibrio maerlii]